MYNYGIIGNCQIAALIGKNSSIDWLCFPRPDSAPVFGALLDEQGGKSIVELDCLQECTQSYIENTNVLETFLTGASGQVKITDFCPRFKQHGRMYRPAQLVRIIEPASGAPRIRIKVDIVNGWSKNVVKSERGNSHLRFKVDAGEIRVTLNAPITYIESAQEIVLREPIYLIFSWDLPIEDQIENVAKDFLAKTISHWRQWTASCNIPTLYQKETIRSALVLKLHCYEDTGAVLAALTTSLPEEIGGTRNWDYRFCWLRDAFFVVHAFYRLGCFDEVESFTLFLIDLVKEDLESLHPVYCLDRTRPIPEHVYENWSGYLGSRPVRSNNQAGEHIQNDVYGEILLTVTPIFLDERLRHLRTDSLSELLNRLVKLTEKSIASKDAGLWELRNTLQEHTFTNLMCWAGLKRLNRIIEHGTWKTKLHSNIKKGELSAHQALARSIKNGVICSSPELTSLDASTLLAPILGFANKSVSLTTIDAIQKELGIKNDADFLLRYQSQDDFGVPKSSFVVCTFWLSQALARLGELSRGLEVFDSGLRAANHLLLLSEHYDPALKQQLGNFPQAYSHVGLILAAFAVSPSWDEWL